MTYLPLVFSSIFPFSRSTLMVLLLPGTTIHFYTAACKSFWFVPVYSLLTNKTCSLKQLVECFFYFSSFASLILLFCRSHLVASKAIAAKRHPPMFCDGLRWVFLIFHCHGVHQQVWAAKYSESLRVGKSHQNGNI